MKKEITSAFKALGSAINLWWDDWANQVVVSLVAVLLSLTIILFPASLMGIYYETNQLVNGTKSGFIGFWHGFKSHLLKSLIWGVVSFIGIFITVINLWFYVNFDINWSYLLVGFTLILGALFFLVQFYSPGFLAMSDDKSLLRAWKKSFAFMMSHPLHCLIIGFIALVLSIINIALVIPLLMGLPPLISLISLNSIKTMQPQQNH